jgi:hypothetical protein
MTDTLRRYCGRRAGISRIACFLLCAAVLPLSVLSSSLLFFTKNSPFSPSLYGILAHCLSTQLISTCGLSQYIQDFLTHVSFYILHSQNTIKTFIYFPFNLAKKTCVCGGHYRGPETWNPYVCCPACTSCSAYSVPPPSRCLGTGALGIFL